MLGLSGCSNGQPSNGEQQSSATEADAESVKPTALSAVLDADEAALTAPDVFFAITPAMTMLKRHVFEGLYDVDPHTGKVSAGLAAEAPSAVNATTYEVALREDAAFSDGTPLTAAHVAAAYAELIASSDAYATLLAPIATVTAPSKHTVRITLTADEPAFLQQRLALIKVGAIADGALAGRIGSGPWAWTAELPDEIASNPSADASAPALPTISFAPNPHYTGSATATALAMSWSFASDASERASMFASGRSLVCADAVTDGASVLESRESTVEYVPGTLSPFLMFNCAKAPFNNECARQAMLYAIDYDRLIAQCFNGHAAAATSPLPLVHANYHRATTVYSHDITRAQHLLERVGITPDAPADFSLIVCGEWLRPAAEAIAEDMAETGVSITVEVTDEAGLAERSTLFDMALCADDPSLLGSDCDLFLTWRYGGDIAPESYAGWKSSEAHARVMENLRLARIATDGGQQQKLWNECFDLIAESAPLYPLCFCEIPTAWRADALSGFSPLGTGCIDLLGVSLR